MKLFKILMAIAVFALITNQSKAQQKIGFIFLDSINKAMQHQFGVETAIKEYEQELTVQSNLLNRSYVDETNRMIGIDRRWAKQDISREDSLLRARQEEIRSFSLRSEKLVNEKLLELTKPITDSIVGATKKIAIRRGYGYVIDISNQHMLVYNKADDLTAAVKALLNVH